MLFYVVVVTDVVVEKTFFVSIAWQQNVLFCHSLPKKKKDYVQDYVKLEHQTKNISATFLDFGKKNAFHFSLQIHTPTRTFT